MGSTRVRSLGATQGHRATGLDWIYGHECASQSQNVTSAGAAERASTNLLGLLSEVTFHPISRLRSLRQAREDFPGMVGGRI